MQREGVGSAIGLEVVPGQRHSRHRRERAPQAAEQRLSTPLHSVEINHHRPGALPATVGVGGVFLRPRRKPIRVFLEVFAGVVALPLNRFREARIHAEQGRKALIKARRQLGMVLAQMTGATGAVIAAAAGHR